MKRLLLFAVISLSFGCRIEDESLDKKTFSSFEHLCQTKASEFVKKGAANGTVTIVDDSNPSSSGPGKANRAVFDSKYDPNVLLEAVLANPDPVPSVRYVYQLYSNDMKPPEIYKDCGGYFYIDLTHLPFEKANLSNCSHANKWSYESDRSKYVIVIEYGKFDENEIRPFTFQIRDTETNQILAEQKSFQLLLGGMSATRNRSFTNGGWSQRAKTCELTSPDLLLKQAFHK